MRRVCRRWQVGISRRKNRESAPGQNRGAPRKPSTPASQGLRVRARCRGLNLEKDFRESREAIGGGRGQAVGGCSVVTHRDPGLGGKSGASQGGGAGSEGPQGEGSWEAGGGVSLSTWW